jgi:hypothetical protein
MDCEIVKNWVGNLNNTFWYCRDHKVECENATRCPIQAIKEIILESPPEYRPRSGIHVWGLLNDDIKCVNCGVASHSAYSSICEPPKK